MTSSTKFSAGLATILASLLIIAIITYFSYKIYTEVSSDSVKISDFRLKVEEFMRY